MRKRRGRKKATGTRVPLLTVAAPNARWSVDFVHDQFAQGRRFRIFNVIDDVTKECLAAVADTSISGRRVARELTALIARRGRPGLIVSDHGTEFTSNAMLAWSEDTGVAWHFIAPASRCRTGREDPSSFMLLSENDSVGPSRVVGVLPLRSRRLALLARREVLQKVRLVIGTSKAPAMCPTPFPFRRNALTVVIGLPSTGAKSEGMAEHELEQVLHPSELLERIALDCAGPCACPPATHSQVGSRA